MAGTKVRKLTTHRDSDFIFLHREPKGLAIPHDIGGTTKRYSMTVKDFLSDIPSNPVSDTDCPNSGVENILLRPVIYNAGSPAILDVDRIVVSEDMLVGAYTIAATTPAGGGARNVTVTHADDGNVDTLGTIDIVGTDIDDQVLLETITPLDSATAQGVGAFKTVTSVTGVDWIINTVADTLEVGFGDLIGLPDLLPHNTVLFVIFNAIREAVAPTVANSTTVLAENTVDLNSALDGSVVWIYYLV